MRVKEILLFIILFMMVSLNVAFAESVDTNGLSGSQQMKKILEEKKETGTINLPGYVIGEDDGELSEDEESWKVHKAIYDRLTERENIVRQYISPNPNIEIVENEINTNLNSIIRNNIIYIVLFIFVIVLVFFLSIVLKNKKILFVEIVVAIIFITMIINNVFNQSNSGISNKEKNDIIRYLNGEIQDRELDNYANEYKTKYIDKYNEKEVDLSKVVNDYIIKCYYCVKRKASGKELYTSDLEVLNCFEEKSHKYDFTYERRYVHILDWERIDNWQVVNNILSKASMQGIYDSLTEEDIENYNNGSFLDKLVEKIDDKVKSKDDF